MQRLLIFFLCMNLIWSERASLHAVLRICHSLCYVFSCCLILFFNIWLLWIPLCLFSQSLYCWTFDCEDVFVIINNAITLTYISVEWLSLWAFKYAPLIAVWSRDLYKISISSASVDIVIVHFSESCAYMLDIKS